MPDLAAILAANLAKYGKPVGVKPCTLIKVTPTTRTPGALSGGTNPTETSHDATGWIEQLSPRDVDGTLVTEQDRKISLLGASIDGGVVPKPGDKVTIEDPDGTTSTYRLISPITGDAVGAVYTFVARK